ncbi:hypothetical protein [Dactylosporangium sp. NPDC048998]|uniref:hypothetical protein n=1 Tax=Dactylosporangium sp. NPDC048998 TaxID=3363976 RepID=UPI00370FAFBE
MRQPLQPGRRLIVVALTLVADIVLAVLLFLGIAVDRIGREGFRSASVSPAEFRDWLIILACWGVVMVTIAVAGLLRGRPGIALLQALVMPIVLVCWAPTFERGWHESHRVRPQPAPSTPVNPCVHGNCPGG